MARDLPPARNVNMVELHKKHYKEIAGTTDLGRDALVAQAGRAVAS